MVAYAVSCGLPILMIGGFGGRITRDLPHVFSLGDFIGWRFGPIARTLLFVMTMFMMCIFVLAGEGVGCVGGCEGCWVGGCIFVAGERSWSQCGGVGGRQGNWLVSSGAAAGVSNTHHEAG